MEITRELDLAKILERKSCFLFGPRLCGKSWLVNHSLKDATVLDLLSGDVGMTLLANPSSLEQYCTEGRVTIIDEIQKIPMLLDEVHRLIERRGMKFLLTGSSARKLRRAGVNLLGGRASIRHLPPLSAFELGGHFSLTRAINDGLLPSIYFSAAPDEDLRDYVSLYLKEEIIAEGLTRNLPAFGRFLEVAALSNGRQINCDSLARQAHVPRSTLQQYFSILFDTLLAFRVPAWGRGLSRKAASTAKFYLFDTGVTRAIQKRNMLAPRTPEFGEAFEHYVMHELRCCLCASGRDDGLAYWRTYAGDEVDFIFDDRIAIEAKSTNHVDPEHLKGLLALMEEKKLERYVVVSRDPLPRRVGNILVLPYGELPGRLRADDWR